MGKVAGELADVPILTSDNPRSEDPLKIIAEVEEGVKESGNSAYRVVSTAATRSGWPSSWPTSGRPC
jgi:UDP-N-acetylmuramyl tripeptide synthase